MSWPTRFIVEHNSIGDLLNRIRQADKDWYDAKEQRDHLGVNMYRSQAHEACAELGRIVFAYGHAVNDDIPHLYFHPEMYLWGLNRRELRKVLIELGFEDLLKPEQEATANEPTP